jgi:hypothetical protein
MHRFAQHAEGLDGLSTRREKPFTRVVDLETCRADFATRRADFAVFRGKRTRRRAKRTRQRDKRSRRSMQPFRCREGSALAVERSGRLVCAEPFRLRNNVDSVRREAGALAELTCRAAHASVRSAWPSSRGAEPSVRCLAGNRTRCAHDLASRSTPLARVRRRADRARMLTYLGDEVSIPVR